MPMDAKCACDDPPDVIPSSQMLLGGGPSHEPRLSKVKMSVNAFPERDFNNYAA
jgi:hypothetical protein